MIRTRRNSSSPVRCCEPARRQNDQPTSPQQAVNSLQHQKLPEVDSRAKRLRRHNGDPQLYKADRLRGVTTSVLARNNSNDATAAVTRAPSPGSDTRDSGPIAGRCAPRTAGRLLRRRFAYPVLQRSTKCPVTIAKPARNPWRSDARASVRIHRKSRFRLSHHRS